MAALRLDDSDQDAILPVSIGTAVWGIVLIVLLLMRPTLEENGTSWWVTAALVGVVSGLGGVLFLMWRKRRSRSRQE